MLRDIADTRIVANNLSWRRFGFLRGAPRCSNERFNVPGVSHKARETTKTPHAPTTKSTPGTRSQLTVLASLPSSFFGPRYRRQNNKTPFDLFRYVSANLRPSRAKATQPIDGGEDAHCYLDQGSICCPPFGLGDPRDHATGAAAATTASFSSLIFSASSTSTVVTWLSPPTWC